MALILSILSCIIASNPENTIYSETGESLRVSTDKFLLRFVAYKELMQMTKTNPPLPSFLFFCSRPNFLDLLSRKRLLRLFLSVLFFSCLEQILIK